MKDNKYPLFSPQLMFVRSFRGEIINGRYALEGFRPCDPLEPVNGGSLGIAIEKMSKKIDPNNPYFSRVYQFAKVNRLNMDYFKKKESEQKTEFPKSKVLKK